MRYVSVRSALFVPSFLWVMGVGDDFLYVEVLISVGRLVGKQFITH